MIYNLNGDTVIARDYFVKAIAHRGYSTVAPENTLPAYILAKKRGFFYVETDVDMTKDRVPVLLHDGWIDRTSDGTGALSSFTFEQVREFDFGSWKSPDYVGTKIPSFDEFLTLCRNAVLHPYIELKNTASYTESEVQALVDAVEAHGLKGRCTWISFSDTYLGYIRDYDPDARLGYVISSVTGEVITTAQGLKTSTNEVFIDSSGRTDTESEMCLAAKLPHEVWTIDSEAVIKELNPYVTGVTSNSMIAGEVLYKSVMG